MNSKLLICVLSLVLSACTYLPFDDENSSYSQIPEGSSLVLKRSVVVPANRLNAFLDQASNPPAALTSDERETSCTLKMRNKHRSERSIETAEFRVTRVKDDLYYTFRKPIQVAFGDLGAPSIESHSTTLYLHSEKHPDVHSVTCEFDAFFSMGFPLPIATIRWALSAHFDLVIAKNAS